MEWTDEALVLGAARHGESSIIVDLLTRLHGRHKGLVRGGTTPRMRGVMQPGNRVAVTWRGRLPEHLGTATLELVEANAASVLADPGRLAALGALCAVAATALPERESHPEVFLAALPVIELMRDESSSIEDVAAALVYWEMGLLGALGYGLDLHACAVTGLAEDLAYVSPRSGRAVSRAGAGAYADRLLPLPAFLLGEGALTAQHVVAGFDLTGYFLERSVFVPSRMRAPPARGRFIDLLQRTSSGRD
jgi:DNA repair protein RecO (recombination protein O)